MMSERQETPWYSVPQSERAENWYTIHTEADNPRQVRLMRLSDTEELARAKEIVKQTNDFIDEAKIYSTITNVIVDNQHLVIHFSNGLTFDCGVVSGDYPVLRSTTRGIEVKYHREPDSEFRVLVPAESIKVTFERLSEEQKEYLAANTSSYLAKELTINPKGHLVVGSNDIGRITFVHKGAWSATTNYEPNDVVVYNDSSWVSLTEQIGTPPTEGEGWNLFVKSAYQAWLEQGNEGDEAAFLDSLTHTQADWNQADTQAKDYIRNKPSQFEPTAHSHTQADISDFPASIPASGGNSDTVNGHRVESDVPANAVFTDTLYDDTELRQQIVNTLEASKRYTNEQVSQLAGFRIEVVLSLPLTGKTGVIYLVQTSQPQAQDGYDEYIWSNGAYERIGNTSVNLADYSTTEESDAKYVAKVPGKQLSTHDFGDAEQKKLSTLENYNDSAVRQLITDTQKSIPTRLSELQNDNYTVTDPSYVHTENNFTTTEKKKLAGIADGAEANVNADWNATVGQAAILNKPRILSEQEIEQKIADAVDQTGGGDYRVSNIVQKWIEQITASSEALVNLTISQEDYNTLNSIATENAAFFPASSKISEAIQIPAAGICIFKETSPSNPNWIEVVLYFNSAIDARVRVTLNTEIRFKVYDDLSVTCTHCLSQSVMTTNGAVQQMANMLSNGDMTTHQCGGEFIIHKTQDKINEIAHFFAVGNQESHSDGSRISNECEIRTLATDSGIKISLSAAESDKDQKTEFKKEISLLTNGTGGKVLTDDGTYKEMAGGAGGGNLNVTNSADLNTIDIYAFKPAANQSTTGVLEPLQLASSTKDGLLSMKDKEKLDGLPTAVVFDESFMALSNSSTKADIINVFSKTDDTTDFTDDDILFYYIAILATSCSHENNDGSKTLKFYIHRRECMAYGLLANNHDDATLELTYPIGNGKLKTTSIFAGVKTVNGVNQCTLTCTVSKTGDDEYYLPKDVSTLRSSSTSDDVVNAFGGVDNIANVLKSIGNAKKVYLYDNIYRVPVSVYQLSSTFVFLSYTDPFFERTRTIYIGKSGIGSVQEYYLAPYDLKEEIVRLTSHSTSDEISTAVGGESGMKGIITEMKKKREFQVCIESDNTETQELGLYNITSYLYRENINGVAGDMAIWLFAMGYGFANSFVGGGIAINYTKETNTFAAQQLSLSANT